MKTKMFAEIRNRMKTHNYYIRMPLLLLLVAFFLHGNAQNYAVSFDGYQDRINTTVSRTSLTDFTMMAWFRFDGATNETYRTIIGSSDGSFFIGKHSGNTWLGIQDGNYISNLATGTNAFDGNWHHLAVTRSGSTIKAYLDGFFVGSNSSFSGGSGTLFIGDESGNYFWKGAIDEVRIYDYAFVTPEEVVGEMYTELFGTEAGLILSYNLNEGFGTTATDLSPNGNNGTLEYDATFVTSNAPVSSYNSATAPFAPVDPTGLPYSVIVSDITLNGGALPPNATVAAFDDTLCVGSVMFNDPNTQMICWEGDAGQGLLGFTSGHPITFKVRTVWYSQVEIFTAVPTFTAGNGNFGNGMFSVVSLNVTTSLASGIALSETLFNFDAMPINTSKADTLVITNNGSANLNITSLATSSTNYVVSPTNMIIAPGANDTAIITFTPTLVANYAETLTITSDDPAQPTLTVALHGIGMPTPTPSVSIVPGSLNFGTMTLGDSLNLPFTIENGGNGDYEITNVSVNLPSFTLTGPTSLTLTQNQNQQYQLSFTAPSLGTFTGAVLFSSPDGNVSMPIYANVVEDYFSPVQPTGLPYNIVVNSVTIDGQNLSFNDQVAVFDDTLCVGVNNVAYIGGDALILDGSGDYLSATVNVSETNYTAEMWFKANSDGGLYSVVGGGHDRHIYLHNGGNIYTRVWSNETINTSGTNYADGQWHHVAHVFGGSQGGQKIYVDGVLQASGSKASSNFTSQSGINIGYSADKGYFNGAVDEVRIWNYAKSQSEIISQMNQSLFGSEPNLLAYYNFNNNQSVDVTGNGHNGTLYGNAYIDAASDIQSGSMNIVTWEGDPSQGLLGFAPNNPMSFKIMATVFDSLVELSATPIYLLGNGNFGFAPFTVVDLTAQSGFDPELVVSNTSIYVGQVEMNQSISDTFMIYNTGNAQVNLHIEVLDPVFSSSLQSSSLMAGDSTEVIVNFSPTSAGNYSSALMIYSNDPDHLETTVALEGFALPIGQTDINLSQQNLQFNTVVLGQSESLFFNVINNGTAPLEVTGISSSDGSFVVSPSSFILQNTNDNQLVEVQFTPTSKGMSTGDLTIQSNAGNPVISMSGVGIDGHFASVSETGMPYSIIIEDHNLMGHLAIGDEVAVYDGSLCVGVSAVLSDTGNILLVAWEADASQGLAGFTSGNTMSYKVWTSINHYPSEFAASATYTVGNGTFGFGQFSVCNLDIDIPIIEIDPTSFFVALDEPDSTVLDLEIINNGPGDLYYQLMPGESPFGKSVSLDGINDYVNMGSLSPGNTWTLEAWVKPSSTPSGRKTIFGGYGSCNDWGITMVDGYFGVTINPPSACTQTILGGAAGLAVVGEWTHVAATCDGANAYIYVNGILLNSGPVINNYIGYSNVRLGGEACCSGNNFPGLVDEVRLWNYARTEAEIATFMTNTPQGTEPGLTRYYSFEDGTANNVLGTGNNGSLQSGASIVSPGAPAYHNWVQVPLAADTLAANSTDTVQLNVFTEGLVDGLYNIYFNVESNAPGNPTLLLPVTLNVTGNPQISIAPMAIDFGELIVGNTSTEQVSITNIGTDSLIISDMYFENGQAFGFANTVTLPVEIAPLASETLDLLFNPSLDGLELDSLWIISNASNQDTAVVAFEGTGLTPADIEVSTLSWSGSMNSGEFYIDTFYIYNYGQANLDFVLDNSIPWLSLNPASGTIGVADSMAIQLNISTVGVYAGDYAGTFDINSNDLIDPTVVFSLNLAVSGQPDLAAPDYYNFDTVNVGDVGIFDFIIQNIGSDTLVIDSMEVNNTAFSFAGPGSFNILPGQQDTVPLLFIPTMAIPYSGIFTLYSNAVNWPVFTVAMQGVGNLPPNIVVSTDTVSFTTSNLLAGTETFSIQNTGGQPLNFNLKAGSQTGNLLSLDGNADYLNVANAPELNPDTAMTIEAWVYPTENTNEYIVAKEYSAVGNYRLFINGNGKLQFQINDSYSVVSNTGIATHTWTHVAASTNGKTMQVFIDGVLDGEANFTPFTINANSLNLRVGRSYFNEYFEGKMDELRIWDIYKNDFEVSSAMDRQMFGNEPGLVLYFKFDEPGGNIALDASVHGNNGTFYGDATRGESGDFLAPFFSFTPTSGTLTQNATQSVSVDFAPDGFAEGLYELPLLISSNDPDLPETQILVQMEVLGIPNISPAVSSSILFFGDTYLTSSDTMGFVLMNPGQSIITLGNWILSDPDFRLEFEYPFVYPYSAKYVKVIFEPTTAGSHIDTLRIYNTSGTQVIGVAFSANGLHPADLSISQMSMSDSLYWGSSSTKQLRLTNNGDGPLDFDFTGIPTQWLTISPSTGVVPANSYLDVDFAFNGTNDGGNYLEQIVLNTNDLNNPQMLISASLLIYGAEMAVSASTLSKYVTYQEMEYDTFYIVNNGYGPLNYTLTETASWLSLSQTSGTVPVGGHDSIFVTYNGDNPHGSYQADIAIASNDPAQLQSSITVNMHVLHATLVSIPTTLNFGYTVVNVGETRNLEILNNGNVNITIDSIHSLPPYTMPDFAGTFLAPGASISVPVNFMPSYTVTYNETIYIETNIGQFATPVTGKGEMPHSAWHYTWTKHDFGLVDNAVGAVKNLTIYNWGNVPFTMDDFHNSDSLHFYVSDSIFTIPVGGHKTVQVYFEPDAIAIYESTMLWTCNAIGTVELLLDGRGFFLSDAPMLTYVDSLPYNGFNGVDPLIGSTDQWFEYRVIYTDADNHPPMEGYPVVGVGMNGDTDFLDSGEDEFTMFEVDPSDVDYTDGKEYFYATQLPLNFDLGYSFFAYDSLGNPPVGEGVNYRSDPSVSNDFLDLSIYANDINFSNLTPAVGEVVTITATVHNNSDYPASAVSVKFYEEDSFLVEMTIPYIGPQSYSNVSITHVFPIDEYYPMKVVVDEQNLIIEDNELNNFAIRPVLVGEFSIPGSIQVSANIAPAAVLPYGTVHYWGHADYVNSYDPNANVSGAQVVMTIVETGYTYTTYTNSLGDYSIYFTAPPTPGTYTVTGTVTDFTLMATMPIKTFTVYIPSDPIIGPDLAIRYWWGTDIHWTSDCKRIGDPIEVTAIVTNIGNATAYDALVHVFQDGNLILSPVYDSIPAGTNKTITFWVTYNTVGYHNVSVDIDPYDDIWELQEWNNFGQKTRWIYPLEPDLKPTNIWFSDNSPLQGHPINMTFRSANTQCTPTDTCSADIYHIYGPDTFFLANVPVDAIGSLTWDQQYLYNQTFNQVGWHHILYVVDPYDNVTELEEGNNELMASFYVEQAIADLKISDISFSAYNPPIGGFIDFTATIWNNGTADAYDFYVRYYIDGVQLSDSILVPFLAAGTNMFVTSDPWQVEDCGHEVSATVDEDDLIPEINEYNNYTDRPIGTDLKPSFWPYYWNDYVSILQGTTLNIKSRIHNLGTLDADTVFVSYVMNNQLLVYDGVPLVNHESYAASNHLYTFNYTGDYYITAYADMIWPDSTRYCELNETNNTDVLHVHVYGEDPDLEVLSQHISPTELNPDPGEYINIFGSFTNEGNVPAGPFWVRFYANSEALGDSIYIPGLAAHEDSTVACTDSFASNLIGTHVIRMELDIYDEVQEYNELNNMASRAIIVGDAPDHTFSDAGQGIWLSDTFPNIGDTIIINPIIENNGGATGTADLVLSLEVLNQTTVLTTIPFTAAPYDSIDVPFEWVVTSPYGRIHAEIINSNPEEFNLYNNDTYIDYGDAVPPLLVSLDPSATLICAGENVSITSTVSGGLGTYFYTWVQDPYTGATSDPDILVSPDETTTYTLTVEDGIYTSSVSVTIVVYDVDVDLGPDLSLCGDTSYVLDAGNFDTYLWSTGETTQTITITDNGQYWVDVEMVNYGCSDRDTIVVDMYQGLTPINEVYNTCGTYYFVYESPRQGNYTFAWSNGSQGSSTTFTQPGDYYATVTDTNGCSTIDTVTFIVDEISVDLGPDQTVCLGQSVTLDAGQGVYEYLWSTQETTQTIQVLQSGTYAVTITDDLYCNAEDSVTINFVPGLNPNLGGTVYICPGETAVLDPGQFDNYLWNNQSTDANLTVSSEGTYSVTVSDQSGCSGIDSVEVVELTVPDVDIDDITLCSAPVYASAGMGMSWQWSNGATTSYILVDDIGEYSLTVTFQNGCTDRDTFNVYDGLLHFDLGNDTAMCDGDSVLINGPIDATSFLWSTGATTSSVYIDDGGMYYLSVTNPQTGCVSVDSIYVTLNQLPEIVWGRSTEYLCRPDCSFGSRCVR